MSHSLSMLSTNSCRTAMQTHCPCATGNRGASRTSSREAHCEAAASRHLLESQPGSVLWGSGKAADRAVPKPAIISHLNIDLICSAKERRRSVATGGWGALAHAAVLLLSAAQTMLCKTQCVYTVGPLCGLACLPSDASS